MLMIIKLYLTHQNRNVFLFSHAAISLRPLVLNQSFLIGGNLIEYVKKWPHLGQIVTDSLEDAADIAGRRNSLCGKINNFLCYFGKLGHVTKQSLMFSFCTNFYGSELWNLGNPSVQDFCTA